MNPAQLIAALMWPSRVHNLADAARLCRQPRLLANTVYSHRNGNGDAAPSAATVTGGGTQILNITGQEGGALWINASSLGFRCGSGGSAMSQGVQGSAAGNTDGVSASRPGQGGTGAFTGAGDTARNGGDGYDAYVVIEEYA